MESAKSDVATDLTYLKHEIVWIRLAAELSRTGFVTIMSNSRHICIGGRELAFRANKAAGMITGFRKTATNYIK